MNWRMEAAALCFEGKALNWLQWLEFRSLVKEWFEFRKQFVERFQDSQLGDEYEALMALKQETTRSD